MVLVIVRVVPPHVGGDEARRGGIVGDVRVFVMHDASAGMEYAPHVVYHLSVCLGHVKIEPIRVLSLEVAQQGLAETSRLHHSAHRIALEECVELRDGAVEGLGGRAALEFKVHLLRVRGAVGGGADESGELLGMEGSVLDRGIREPGRKESIHNN